MSTQDKWGTPSTHILGESQTAAYCSFHLILDGISKLQVDVMFLSYLWMCKYNSFFGEALTVSRESTESSEEFSTQSLFKFFNRLGMKLEINPGEQAKSDDKTFSKT
ncbi:hypothetical protein CLU79DRAFT_723962 [Phycomyces nitens]|nr:hypothetical protein CLU79DRAFT_723962 [Phycomyces nitens]